MDSVRRMGMGSRDRGEVGSNPTVGAEVRAPIMGHPIEVWPIEVWRVPVAGLEERCARVLDAEERARAGRYLVAAARVEFTVARGCLRMLLGEILSVAPEEVAFEFGTHGKPGLAGGVGPYFNVAHSHGMILIAICRHCAVGIDVERMAEGPELMEIARESFTERDSRSIEMAADPLQAFYRCWTKKEAVTKADGRGLGLGLASFEVSMESSEREVEIAGTAYSVEELEVGDGYAAAVAVAGRDATIRLCDWPAAQD